MIKNILVSIEYEINENFKKYYGKWDLFIEEIKDILGYYKKSIYKCGKIVINKKIGNSTKNIQLNEIDKVFLDKYLFDDFLNTLNNAITSCTRNLNKNELYDELISIIIGELIILFKISQINECKNLNIKQVKLISDNIYSCDLCKTRSRFIYNVEDFNIKMIHPYCKLNIFPICDKTTDLNTTISKFKNVPFIYVNIIKNINMKLSIYLKKYITPKEFIFKNDLENIYIDNDKIYISLKLIDKLEIDKLIVRELLKDKLLQTDLSWWEKEFNKIKNNKNIGDDCIIYATPLINNTSILNHKEYFIQSYINYILNSNDIKLINNDAYKQLKDLFGKEFIKG